MSLTMGSFLIYFSLFFWLGVTLPLVLDKMLSGGGGDNSFLLYVSLFLFKISLILFPPFPVLCCGGDGDNSFIIYVFLFL